MRIEWLSIDGFGHFSGYESGPLNGRAVVFYGPNEAGKTTLLAFIRAILFGFPRRTDPLWFPALAGGKHGGRIRLCDGHIVERYQGVHGGPVTVTLPDGSQAGTARLNELLGHASRDVFENVFAFGLAGGGVGDEVFGGESGAEGQGGEEGKEGAAEHGWLEEG